MFTKSCSRLFFHRIALLCALFVLTTGAVAAQATTWKKVDAASEGFSVSMPGEHGRIQLPSPQDTVLKAFTHSAMLEGVAYTIITVETGTVDWSLSASRDGFVRGMTSSACAPTIAAGARCDLKVGSDTQYQLSLSRNFVMVINDNQVGVGRIVFGKKWVYTLMVVGVDLKEPLAKKFLDSFEITAK